jgi:hypothetical protein
MLRTVLLATLAFPLCAQPPAVEGTPANLAAIRFIDIAAGTGAPYAAGKQLTVHYTGWLTDGKKFDSSVDRQQPFDFIQGRRQVITGWDLGLEGMKVGGKRRLFIPYQFAYGEAGSGPIPPRADLIFDVELLGVADAKTLPPAIDILVPMQTLESRLTSLANAIPADKYSWNPAPNARTVAEVIAHTNAVLQSFTDALTETSKVSELSQTTTQSKDASLAMLGVKFAVLRKEAEGARNGSLAADAELAGTPTNRRGLFSALNVALGADLGQLTVYAASLELVLPWKPGSLD